MDVAARAGAWASVEKYGPPLHSGVTLVGSTSITQDGTLVGFGNNSYGKIPYDFVRSKDYMEFAISVVIDKQITSSMAFGLLSYIGSFDGFTPFYKDNYGETKYNVAWLSTNGTSWNVWDAMRTGDILWNIGEMKLKCIVDGVNYSWYEMINGLWVPRFEKIGQISATKSGLQFQLGTNRGTSRPFPGGIKLDECYIVNGKDLWWEGEAGAYKRVNGMT